MTSLSDLEPKCLAWKDLDGRLSFNNKIKGSDYFQEISFKHVASVPAWLSYIYRALQRAVHTHTECTFM